MFNSALKNNNAADAAPTFIDLKNQSQEIKALWLLKAVDSNSILEMRAIDQISGRLPIVKLFYSSQYETTEDLKRAFEAEAIKLNQQRFNIYFVMNSIKESFTGRSAKDVDILHRNLLLIDIDRVSSTGQPSNQSELDSALELAKEIAKYLSSLGWGEPIWVLSGNGYHLYYSLKELPNDTSNTNLVSELLKELANNFHNNTVKVDSVVSNASRITKVPGTIAYKGTESSDRPYRMARVLS